MHGTVGGFRVGLNYTVRNNTDLVSAHYFYASQLKDIRLTGEVRGETVYFKGADGSAFQLHFVGNGSNGNNPLTFSNSIGLSGTCVLGSRTLPVTLKMSHGTANPGQRFYGDVTSKTDAEFERMVQTTQRAILAHDVDMAVRNIHFPLKVNRDRRSFTITSPAQLKSEWPRVFSPAFIAKLREAIPHEMFVREGKAMLGDGELWFDEGGLVVVNSE